MKDVLVVNAGSSSLKLRTVSPDGSVSNSADYDLPAGSIRGEITEFCAGAHVAAAGHRVVHGGPKFPSSVVLDDGVIEDLEALSELAPLHNSPAVEAIRAARGALPGIAHVACFDTSFHSTIPDTAALYAIPRTWTTDLGIRRYGFHGLSHQYAAGRAAEMTGRPLQDLHVVTCHLGAGASLAAVAGGISVDTTMGFTPLEGLVMATRSGSIDPGAVLWAMEQLDFSPRRMRDALEFESGLLALSEISADMRIVEQKAAQGDERAAVAVGVYIHRLTGQIAAMAASAGGLDVLVFTGGVGEGSASVRRKACAALGFLGVALDEEANRLAATGDRVISAEGSAVKVLLVRAAEELIIAAEVRRLAGALRA